MKRIFDFLFASLGIIFFTLPALLFALLVKAEDGGPIFYTQERWGRRGRKFQAYKFRTMVPGAEKKWGLKPALENDARITKMGKFLRATAMDELPQLINIWKGDMGFVGPRALSVNGELTPSFPNFLKRHQIRPGLTGLAQVMAPRDASLEEKFKHDLDYIRNRTFLGDLKLILISIGITLRGKWESRDKKI